MPTSPRKPTASRAKPATFTGSADVHALIDRVAPVVRACHPEGKVRLGGATWDARCDQGADLGDQVVVRAWDHLTLIVERA